MIIEIKSPTKIIAYGASHKEADENAKAIARFIGIDRWRGTYGAQHKLIAGTNELGWAIEIDFKPANNYQG